MFARREKTQTVFRCDDSPIRVERADEIGDKGAAGLHKSLMPLMRVGR